MTTFQKVLNSVLVLAILFVGYVSLHGKSSLGDATVSNYPTWYYGGIVIGPNNKLISQVQSGTCTLTGAASTNSLAVATLACAATGAKVGDVVLVQQDAPTVSFPVVGASVTSADSIAVILSNLTGGTATPSAGSLGVHYTLWR